MNNRTKLESFCKGRRSKFKKFQNQDNLQCSENNQQPSVLFTNVQRNDIALLIKNYYYDNNDFWNISQKLEGFVREWTSEQVDQIFYDIMKEFFSTKPIYEWGDQIRHRILGTIIAIPLILDNTPDHPSKAGIARKSCFRKYSSAIDGLVKLLRPDDYQGHFSWDNNRNLAKRFEVRKIIAMKRSEKVKIDDIRNSIATFMFKELIINPCQELSIDYILDHIDKNIDLKMLKDVKFTDYIKNEIEKTIKTVLYIIAPIFTNSKGLNQSEIQQITNCNTHIIKNISIHLEHNFPDVYNHEERLYKGWNKGLGSRKTSNGTILKEFIVRNCVCNYLFSKLRQNWNQEITLEHIKIDINFDPYLTSLIGLNISKYLEKQFCKFLIAVPLITEPYFSSKINLDNITIEGIHVKSGLGHEQIRQISKNFEKEFGENIYNDEERFPIPQHQTVDEIKGYPKEFYDPKLREYIRLSQTVSILSKGLVQDNNGIFRDLLTGESITKNDKIHLHHINYNKKDNRIENLCFLKEISHNKISANQFNKTFAKFYKVILKRNKMLLKTGIIPKTWLDKNRSILNYIDENQLNLNKWL